MSSTPPNLPETPTNITRVGDQPLPQQPHYPIPERGPMYIPFIIVDQASCRKLWQRLPLAYTHCRNYVIFCKLTHLSIPVSAKTVGKLPMSNAGFCTLRQRLARFVRKTLSFSKLDKFHQAFTRLFIHHYNLSCIS